jgi:hypothetical protein
MLRFAKLDVRARLPENPAIRTGQAEMEQQAAEATRRKSTCRRCTRKTPAMGRSLAVNSYPAMCNSPGENINKRKDRCPTFISSAANVTLVHSIRANVTLAGKEFRNSASPA